MTSAIMNPLHAEVRQAIWAADVMNGQRRALRAPGSRRNGDVAARRRRRGARAAARRRQAEGGAPA